MPRRLALAVLLFMCAIQGRPEGRPLLKVGAEGRPQPGSAVSLLPAQSGNGTYVIRNVRVFDGETVAERQTVVIGQGTIAALGNGATVTVPTGAQEVAGEGRTLLPGLMDAHVHLPLFGSDQALQQNLAFGVTTTVVMWAAPTLVSRIKELDAADRLDVASVLTAGTGATAPGGHPTQMDPQGRLIPTLSAPSEAEAFVAARIAEGSDFIKIIYDDTRDSPGGKVPTLNDEIVTALVRAAHARGRIAVAHIGNEEYARGAIAAGVDGLAHLFLGPRVSADFGQFAASRGVFVIPTLSVLYSSCGRPDGPSFLTDADTMKYVRPQFHGLLEMAAAESKVSCDAAPQALRQLVAAKVPVLAGTDAPAPGLAYGASLHKELEHLVNAGLTPTAALAAATSAISRAFRLNDRGRIRTGLRADLLLVDGDPTKQIRDTRNVAAIWKRGVRVQRAAP
jgi:imidazolonepropionase-like amidohydrolase